MQWVIGKQSLSQMAQWTGLDAGALSKVIATVLVIVGYLLLTRLVRIVFLRRVEAERRYRLNRATTYVIGFLAAAGVIKIWLLDAVNLTTYLGILSAGLAIALKDLIVNLAGWLFILWRHPFRVGDRIEVGGQIGDVVDMRMFMFSMLEVGNWVHSDQSTGRILHVPNGRIFSHPCANYTQGFDHVWHEMPVTVTFESDWQAAREILEDILKREAPDAKKAVSEQMANNAVSYAMHFKHLTPIVWLEVIDIGVQLTMRFLCPVRARRSTAERLWKGILEDFGARDDIDFAYPTQRFFDNAKEGKVDARATEPAG